LHIKRAKTDADAEIHSDLSVIASLGTKKTIQCDCEERCNFYLKCTRNFLVAELHTDPLHGELATLLGIYLKFKG